jgi:hypothetical protein
MIDAQGNNVHITSSRVGDIPKTVGKSSFDKYFISVDGLRLVGYSLDTNDEMYSPDAYMIVNHYFHGNTTPYALDLVEYINESEDKIVNLLPGRYKSEKVMNKR